MGVFDLVSSAEWLVDTTKVEGLEALGTIRMLVDLDDLSAPICDDERGSPAFCGIFHHLKYAFFYASSKDDWRPGLDDPRLFRGYGFERPPPRKAA